jgi:hypothetical protein
VGGHIFKIRPASFVAADAIPVILDAQEMDPMFPTAHQGNAFRSGIDAVFDKLGHRFQGIILGKGYDANGVPVIAYA